MKSTSLAIAFSIAALCANAQDSKPESIKELLELTGSATVGIQVMSNLFDEFEKQFTDVPAEYWKNFRSKMNAGDLVNLIIPIYEKYYTEEDVQGLIKFYNTPVGKKVIATLPQVTAESMEAGQQWGESIAKQVLDDMKEKGYYKEN